MNMLSFEAMVTEVPVQDLPEPGEWQDSIQHLRSYNKEKEFEKASSIMYRPLILPHFNSRHEVFSRGEGSHFGHQFLFQSIAHLQTQHFLKQVFRQSHPVTIAPMLTLSSQVGHNSLDRTPLAEESLQ